MASFNVSQGISKEFEGGFWDDPTAGWTYAGVTKDFHPEWPGFNRLANIKAAKFPSKPIPRYTVFKDPVLEKHVNDFYQDKFWKLINGDQIVSQDVANMVFDFFVHKQNDAIKVINDTAKSFSPGIDVFQTKLSPAVIAVMNKFVPEYYARLRNARIVYYQTKKGFSAKNRKAFIARVNKLPVALVANQTASIAPKKKATGFLSWLWS